MYTAQETAIKIKEIAKSKNITIKKMLQDCNLGVNYVSQMAKGKQTNIANLKIIAEYLKTDTDTLLGIVSSNNENHDIKSRDNSLDEMSKELLNQFNSLSLVDRSKVIVFIDELKKKGA